MPPYILAIESSCDETSAAVMNNGSLASHIVKSQQVHASYGGVVPELASRAHQRFIVEVVDDALQSSGIRKDMLDVVAYTRGPGLMGSLLVGSGFAKGMALALNVPLVAVNHIQAHVASHFLEPPVPDFPFLCLIASGGHTQIIRVNDYLDMEVIGQTRDDAVGEAFDKIAKLMGFPYPGGSFIDKFARKGNPMEYSFPYTHMPSLDFSFSGIKTAFLYFLREKQQKDNTFLLNYKSDVCASIQCCLVGMLLDKVEKAVQQTGINRVAVAGGVAANTELRYQLYRKGKQLGWEIFTVSMDYCTDNAAMVAMMAHYQHQTKQYDVLHSSPLPRMTI